NGKGKLTLYQISQVLTIEEHLKQWVDWDRIEQLLISVDGLSTEQVEQQLEVAQQETEEAEVQSQSENGSLVQAEDEDIDLFGLFFSDKQSPAPQASELTLEQRLQNPAELCRFLFGIPLEEVKQKAALASKMELIDRVLELDNNK